MKKLTTEEFIDKANIKHNNKYVYNNCIYTNTSTYLTITCKTHGDFEQRADHHLQGSGCSSCMGDKIRSQNISTLQQFIIKANTKHNNKYDYSKSIYVNARTKLIITCPIHGDFETTPDSHLHTSIGCIGCSIDSHVGAKTDTTNFISTANIVHNFKYTYNNSIFNGVNKKLVITCPIHGDFEQKAQNHLYGKGCRRCNSSKGHITIKNILEKLDYPFYEEFMFDECKNISKLRFDFYLPNHNTCIEFDGQQHFKPTKFTLSTSDTQAIKNLKDCQKRDQIKNSFCMENDINLIRIHYYKFNTSDVEEVLKNIYHFKGMNIITF